MIANPMLYITAGLMTMSMSSVHAGFELDAKAVPFQAPRWLPYAVLGVLAVASIAAAIVFPEVGTAWAD